MYFGSTADREWTELPRTPMYVPLMRQLLAYLTDQLSDRAIVSSGFVSNAHKSAGITPTQEDVARLIVTNIDPRESTLERITSQDLNKLTGTTTEKNSKEDRAIIGLKLPPDSLRPDEIWMNVAWILLAVLGLETLLAGRVHA